MLGLAILVTAVILYYFIKIDQKRDGKCQSAAERRRGEEILRARAERAAEERNADNQQDNA